MEHSKEVAALHARIAELEKLVYVPGMFKCAKCQFGLVKTNISFATGNFSPNDTPDRCPNCDVPLWRVTERDAGNEMVDRATEYLERARVAENELNVFRNGTRIDIEVMSDVFTKYHIRGPWPFHAVIHHFRDVDRGWPHDHPWGFQSIILHGGYVERVFNKDGTNDLVQHDVGESFRVEATHIHRIEELIGGECWTLVLPGPNERESGFWQFREDGAYTRLWHEQEWRKVW